MISTLVLNLCCCISRSQQNYCEKKKAKGPIPEKWTPILSLQAYNSINFKCISFWSRFLDPPQTQLSYKIYRAILRHIFISDTLKAWFAHVHINVHAIFWGRGPTLFQGSRRSPEYQLYLPG